MSQHFEQVVIFAVMSVLVMLFAWMYLRNREKRVGVWMLGWTAIFIHFAAQLMGSFAALSPRWTVFLRIATLEVAGVSFLLSVSKILCTWNRRIVYIFTTGVASILYLSLLLWAPGHLWLLCLLQVVSIATVIGICFLHYGIRKPAPYFWLMTLGPYFGWSLWQVIHGFPAAGLIFYLSTLFAVTGILYMRHYQRYTPGVLTTSLAFMAWGMVFLVSSILQAHRLGPGMDSVFWDLPKYFVAVGMILTLFENETAVATRVAQRYRILFEENLAGVYVSTTAGKILDCNAAFIKMYGYGSKEEVLATPAISFYENPVDRTHFLENLRDHQHIINYECTQRRKDGSLFWILERATIVTESGQRLIEGTAIDITERKQAELELRQSEERFSTIFRHSPVGCGIVSPTGVFLDVNDALVKMFGYPADEVIGKTGVELGLWKSQQDRDIFYERMRAEGSIKNMELVFKDASGNTRVCLYFGTLVKVGGKECIFGMQLDCTEQRELESRFLQAQKMEALGRLAGGVAHDFNNLLGVIGGYAELLERHLGQHEQYKRHCARIIETTQRASGLTNQLLTFSRKEIARPAPLKPNKAIGNLAGMLSRLIGEDIEMILDLRAGATVIIDKIHFEQIIFNIAVNARDAMPGGGQLFIKTESKMHPVVQISGEVLLLPFVSISITDTGVGMDEATRLHAFEPFFTTKSAERGTGLGLATVYGIVQQCKGDINIKSRPGQGTEITIMLPASTEDEFQDDPNTRTELQGGNAHILLVEDEVELRNANAEFLRLLGYAVTCAGTGPEALELIRNIPAVDLVISDVVMPKMSGREFTDRLLQLHPQTKVLFISGYTDDIILQAGISAATTPFLQKPFLLRDLGAKVQELLSPQMQSSK
jgi:PAS domain S-box-containing protein